MKSTDGNNAVFITGVSSGIGAGLGQEYLSQGQSVYGVSRRAPDRLMSEDQFHFAPLDVADHGAVPGTLRTLLEGVSDLELVVLNAGVLGELQDLHEVSLDELKRLMEINLWSNKTILDTLFSMDIPIKQVIGMSSGASVNGNRGWAGYALSKAALNMMMKLYAAERNATHFCAFAPGLVDTPMQDYLCEEVNAEKYPSVKVIRSKRGTPHMPSPDEAARQMMAVFPRLPRMIASGSFVDIRKLPEQGH
jgi:NAD(P)-dependent dehydrogenase (short-subunit alcohol dehydrogenase family)